MVGGLGNLHRDRARRRVDPLGLVAIGMAPAPGGALAGAGPQEPLPLDLHGKLERTAKDRRDIAGAMLDQMFQEGLDRRILPLVHSRFSMGGFTTPWDIRMGRPRRGMPRRGRNPAQAEFPDVRLRCRPKGHQERILLGRHRRRSRSRRRRPAHGAVPLRPGRQRASAGVPCRIPRPLPAMRRLAVLQRADRDRARQRPMAAGLLLDPYSPPLREALRERGLTHRRGHPLYARTLDRPDPVPQRWHPRARHQPGRKSDPPDRHDPEERLSAGN